MYIYIANDLNEGIYEPTFHSKCNHKMYSKSEDYINEKHASSYVLVHCMIYMI